MPLERKAIARSQPPAVGLPPRDHPVASLLLERALRRAEGLLSREALKPEVTLVLEDSDLARRDGQRVGVHVCGGAEPEARIAVQVEGRREREIHAGRRGSGLLRRGESLRLAQIPVPKVHLLGAHLLQEPEGVDALLVRRRRLAVAVEDERVALPGEPDGAG